MRQKRYTLDEIDRMRLAIERGGFCGSGSYKTSERTVEVEARLRTYMQNGSTVEELEEWSRANQIAQHERETQRQEFYRRNGLQSFKIPG